MPSSPYHRRVRLAGLAFMVGGCLVAGAVYVTADTAEDARIDAIAQQREQNALQRLGGVAIVETVEFDAWLSSLWHGERLAYTIATLSLVVGVVLLRISSLMAEDVA